MIHLSIFINNSYLSQTILFSVRDGDTVKHYRIRQLDDGGFFIAKRITFRSLAELVDHYGRDADGLCVNLRQPCSQVWLDLSALLVNHRMFICSFIKTNQWLKCSLYQYIFHRGLKSKSNKNFKIFNQNIFVYNLFWEILIEFSY